MINSTSFGTITIENRVYTSDVVLFPDGAVTDGWWRKKGHLLQLVDLRPLLKTSPDLIVIGTGAHGRMKLHKDLAGALKGRGIDVVAEPTARAMHTYNARTAGNRRVAGCFHLTC